MNKDIILIIISTYLFIGIIHIIIIKLFGGYYARDFKGFWNTLGLLLTSPIIFIFVLITAVIEIPFIIVKFIYEFIRYDIPYYIEIITQRRNRK